MSVKAMLNAVSQGSVFVVNDEKRVEGASSPNVIEKLRETQDESGIYRRLTEAKKWFQVKWCDCHTNITKRRCIQSYHEKHEGRGGAKSVYEENHDPTCLQWETQHTNKYFQCECKD